VRRPTVVNVDIEASVRAREAHEAGKKRLNEAFGMVPVVVDNVVLPPGPRVMRAVLGATAFGEPSGRGTPVRLHPNTPPVRDAWHQARHERRKRAHESRRRNR
jgi:hypothetical protein